MHESDDGTHEALAGALRALAYPTRLELLELLRYPKSVPEIRLSARRGVDDGQATRTAARQTVQGHLAKLVSAGLVEEERSTDGGRTVVRYAANSARLFDTLDALRRVSVRTHHATNDADATLTLTGDAPASTAKGPRLVVARGVEEGRVYALTKRAAGDEGWVVGRRPGHAVRLDFDGYVSTENSVIQSPRRGRFAIRDLGSKNGTSVNWARLRPGEDRALRPGDVLGVGRSLLVFAVE